MNIRKISLHNVGVYQGTQSIVPALKNNPAGGITLITGLNGTGKSTLLSALMIGLYGNRAPLIARHKQGYSAFLSHLRTYDTEPKEPSWVEIDLEFEHNTIRLRRSWHPGKVRMVEDLTIWRQNVLDSALSQAWDAQVEHLIPPELASLFFFDGEQLSEIAESEETPDELRRAVLSLLGVSLVDRSIHYLDRIVRQTVKALDAENESEKQLMMLNGERTELETQRLQIQQELAKATADVDRMEHQVLDAKSQYFRIGGGIVGSEMIESVQQQLDDQLEEVRNHLLELAAGPLPLALTIPLLKKIRRRAVRENLAASAQAAVPVLEQRNSAIEEVLQERFPDAFAAVTPIIESQVDALRREGQTSMLFGLSPHAFNLLEEILDGQSAVWRDAVSTSVTQLRTLIIQRQQNEEQRDNRPDAISALERALQVLSDQSTALSSLKEHKRELEQRLNLVKQHIQRITDQMNALAQEMTNKNEQERLLQFAIRSMDAHRQFRALLIEKKIKALEQAIAQALGHLLRKKSLITTVQVDPKSLKVSLFDGSRELPRNGFSSGERQMIAIAMLWGLSQMASVKLPVIVDTPMARLDTAHRRHFVSGFLPVVGDQVIVLSTDSEVRPRDVERLRPHIGRRYMLNYHDDLKCTVIEEVDGRNVKNY